MYLLLTGSRLKALLRPFYNICNIYQVSNTEMERHFKTTRTKELFIWINTKTKLIPATADSLEFNKEPTTRIKNRIHVQRIDYTYKKLTTRIKNRLHV